MYEKFEGRIVLHQDDVGMCHGANVAFSELSNLGSITSGSVMVPCPWFREAAEMAAANEKLDLGVHLTLTAEKEFYRWRPLTSASKSSGLVDEDGYMWRDVSSVRRNANVDAVELELHAQIDFALASGFDVTHLDAHMGATLSPEFCDIYIRLGVEYQLPVLLTKKLSQYGPNNHIVGVTDDQFAEFVNFAEKVSQPIFDRVLETDFNRKSVTALDDLAYQKMFTKNTTGLTFAALHPNAPGEVEVIEPNQFHVRTQEYEIFSSKNYLSWLVKNEVKPIGMRELRDEMRLAK
ncbi:MAG: ChbG/HpnK family deacetylase [Actinobacteria bacterium]|nr:MAG: ChbG/HpnK family deacetylase [Actinomycetota bacterium]